MNKRNRKADKTLQEALKFCAWVVSKSKQTEQQKEIIPVKNPEEVTTLLIVTNKEQEQDTFKVKAYKSTTIVKLDRNDFRVKIDGILYDKRFKSVTRASEWCFLHVKQMYK